MKRFIDVGAHTGEAVNAALAPKYAFDWIDCFEPAAAARQRFTHTRDRRVRMHPFGLWNQTVTKTLFDPGSAGASIFPDKANLGTGTQEECSFVGAGEWFSQHVLSSDQVFLKLNCEGCECDVIDDLLDSGEYSKVDFMLATLDVYKIPSQRHRAEDTKRRLEGAGHTNYLFTDCATLGVHVPIEAWLHFWLQATGADRCTRAVRLHQLGFEIREAARRPASRWVAALAGGRW